MKRINCLPLLALEVEALGNMYPNVWPADRIMGRRPGKWQFRLPIEEVSPASTLKTFEGNEAIFSDPSRTDSKKVYALAPVEIGDRLWIDEAATVVEIRGDAVTVERDADGSRRSVVNPALAKRLAGLKPGDAVPRPLPAELASLERIRVRAVRPQQLSDMTLAEYQAEAAPISNLAGRGNYIRDASAATGFAWQVWAEKFPKFAGLNSWAWVIEGERVLLA